MPKPFILPDYPHSAPPHPKTINDRLPETSEPEVIGSIGNYDVSIMVECRGWITWHPTSEVVHLFRHAKYPVPRDLSLQHRIYWKKIVSEPVEGTETVTRSFTVKHGSTVTDNSTLAAELGVSYSGLSAKLTMTLDHSVSIMNETDMTHTIVIDPKSHKAIHFSF